MMKASTKGALEICEHEGIVVAPYRDSVGVLTYGVGHTKAAGGPDPDDMGLGMPSDIDAAVVAAVALFEEDLGKYEKRVNAALNVPLKQYQFDAVLSWDFNTGGATWRSGSGNPCQLIRQINSGDMSGAGFMGWLKPPEIKKRRVAEQNLFKTGNYDANGDRIPVWGTDGNGNLTGVIKTVSGNEIAKMLGKPAAKTPTSHKVASGAGAVIAALLAGLVAFGCKIPFLSSMCGG